MNAYAESYGQPIHYAWQLADRHRGHFFDRDTMRSFGSRVLDTVIPAAGGGRSYFVTSERDRSAGSFRYSDGTVSPGAWGGQRRYTVRVISWATGDVDEPDDDAFGAYASSAAATRRARAAAPVPCAVSLHRRYSHPVTHRGRAWCDGCIDEAARMLADRRSPSDGPVPRSEAIALLRGRSAPEIESLRYQRRRR